MNTRTFLLGLAVMLSSLSFAQDSLKVVNEPEQIPQAAQLLEMAGKLVTFGRQTKSALPLIQAVQIYRLLNVTDDPEGTVDAASPFTEEALLADATKFADGNKALLTLIKDTQKTTRGGLKSEYGTLGGPFAPPTRFMSAVDAEDSSTHKVKVAGGQFVQVVVDGNGKGIYEKNEQGEVKASDLRLTVLDASGNVIARDNSRGENCMVHFIPRRTATVTIKVENVGKLNDNYVMYIYKH